MPRGKALHEVLTHEELQAKRGLAAPAPPQPDVLTKLWHVKGRLLTFLRRVLLFVAVVAAALVVHAQEGFRARVAAFVGTGTSAPLVRSASTALPVAAVAAVVLAWCV